MQADPILATSIQMHPLDMYKYVYTPTKLLLGHIRCDFSLEVYTYFRCCQRIFTTQNSQTSHNVHFKELLCIWVQFLFVQGLGNFFHRRYLEHKWTITDL